MRVRIETQRLILSVPTADDLDDWIAFNADREVKRFIGGVEPPSMTWRRLAGAAGSWALRGCGMMSVRRRDTGAWIGMAGPQFPHLWPGTEVGWGLIRSAQGQGFATEAAAAAMGYAVDVLGWTDIVHVIDPDNVASHKVAERLGSRRLGPAHLPAPLNAAKCDLWGQTAADWAVHRVRWPPAIVT
jgi:RimJ/RimL family protein N-acetyltransferase